jgi:hypothetical protein
VLASGGPAHLPEDVAQHPEQCFCIV